MCQFKGAILLKDRVFMPAYDSHQKMLEELGIEDTRENAERLFVRAELLPPRGDVFRPVEHWEFHVDQDIVPDWFVREYEEKRMREAVAEWAGEHIYDGVSGIQKIVEQGTELYFFRDCKDVSVVARESSTAAVEARGSSTATVEAWESSTATVWARERSTATVWARERSTAAVEAWGSSTATVKAWGSSTATVKAWGSSTATVKAWGSSTATVWARERSTAAVEAWGSSTATKIKLTGHTIGETDDLFFAEIGKNVTLSDSAILLDYRNKTVYTAAGDWEMRKL